MILNTTRFEACSSKVCYYLADLGLLSMWRVDSWHLYASFKDMLWDRYTTPINLYRTNFSAQTNSIYNDVGAPLIPDTLQSDKQQILVNEMLTSL